LVSAKARKHLRPWASTPVLVSSQSRCVRRYGVANVCGVPEAWTDKGKVGGGGAK